MRFSDIVRLGAAMLLASVTAARAEVKVVASIKPVHSLVAGVMKGVGNPALLVEGTASPHTFSLKPSKAAELENSDVVFWIGHEISSFLEKPLDAIASKAKVIELFDTSGLIKHKFREGGAFEAHNDHHDDAHETEKHDDHAKMKKAGHSEKDHHGHKEKKEAGHKDDHGHEHGEFDAHVWLDPMNAKVLVREIARVLMEADPANEAKYEANAATMTAKLDALNADIARELTSVGDKGFIVFHDAYQYFERRFGLTASGSITVSPEVLPGAKRVKQLRTKIQDTGVTCVFSEPQFEPKIVATVVGGTSAKTGVLDPLGAGIKGGPELYFKLIRNMAVSFKYCLSNTG